MTDPASPDPSSATDALAAFERLAATRRTNLRIDPDRPVADEIVERLCHLAQWAPNHHRTWPWRFAALTGDARRRLGALVADDLRASGASPDKIAKAEGKYLRAPLMLAVAVGHGEHDDEVRRAEDRDAVAAGVQNLLLGATAAGLATYWGSGAVLGLDGVRRLCRFGAGDTLIALLYVGHPVGDVPVPSRPDPVLHRVT